jgi:hypothetical protein
MGRLKLKQTHFVFIVWCQWATNIHMKPIATKNEEGGCLESISTLAGDEVIFYFNWPKLIQKKSTSELGEERGTDERN